MALFHVSHPPGSGLWGWIHPIYIFLIFPGHLELWTPLQIPSWGPPLGCTLLQSLSASPALLYLKIFPFVSDFLQFEYDMPRCRRFGITLVSVLWASQICDWGPIIYFGKFLTINASNICSPLSLFPISGVPIIHVIPFMIVPKFLDSPFFFILSFSLHFHLGSF